MMLLLARSWHLGRGRDLSDAAKVTQLRGSVTHEDVLQLDVAMRDALPVEVLQGRRELARENRCSRVPQSPASNHHIQEIRLAELHLHETAAVGIVEATLPREHDVGVHQPGPQAAGRPTALVSLPGHDLHSYLAAWWLLPGVTLSNIIGS